MRWGLRAPTAPTSPSPQRRVPSLSALRAERAFQFSSDDFEHAGEIMHDVIVPEADYAVTAARDLQGAGGVFFRLLRVLAAVEFNRELATGTGEIDDMRSDRMLPPKAVLARKLAQGRPHFLLGFRRSPPQSARNLCSPFRRQAMLPNYPSRRAPTGPPHPPIAAQWAPPSPPKWRRGPIYLPLCPLGAERAGVRWGLLSAGSAHLTLPLLRDGPLPLPPKGGEGRPRFGYCQAPVE